MPGFKCGGLSTTPAQEETETRPQPQAALGDRASLHPSLSGAAQIPLSHEPAFGNHRRTLQSPVQAVPFLGDLEPRKRRNCPMFLASLQRKPQHCCVPSLGRNHSACGPDPGKINPFAGCLGVFLTPFLEAASPVLMLTPRTEPVPNGCPCFSEKRGSLPANRLLRRGGGHRLRHHVQRLRLQLLQRPRGHPHDEVRSGRSPKRCSQGC